MVGSEFVSEAEDAVGAGFRGVEVVVGMFEGGEVFNREIFWKLFDREAGKIVGHSMGLWRLTWRVFIYAGDGAD